MKVLICEDEVLIAEHLKTIVESLGHEVVGVAHNITDSFLLLEHNNPDLALLDIRMEDRLDGITLGKHIEQNHQFPFLFISASTDRITVDKALEVSPAGYVTKPFTEIDVYSAMQIAASKRISETDENYLIIKDGYKDIKLPQCEILFLKSDNIYVEVITRQKKFLIRNSLEKLASELDSEIFLKCHRSYVVNLKWVDELETKSLKIKDHIIPISRQFQKLVKDKFKLQ